MRPSEPHTGSAAAGAHTGPHRSSSRGRPGLALGAGGVVGVEESGGDVVEAGAGGGDGGDAPASGSSAE